MIYSASIEWICPQAGVLRLHEGEGGQVGDPYVWACTVARDGDTGTLKGACLPCPIGGPRAIVKAGLEHGMTRRIIERRTATGLRVVKRENAGC